MSHPVHTLVSLLNEHAYTKYFLVIFQPARPFLLHKNEHGVHYYLVPCSFDRESRLVCLLISLLSRM